MYLSKKTILFLLFLSTLFNSKYIFAGGLLPETIIEVGENHYRMIKDFKSDNTVVSLVDKEDDPLLIDSKVSKVHLKRKKPKRLFYLN